MVPAAFVTLEAFPLNPNGKVDRKALPAPDRAAQGPDDAFVAPRDALELRVASIWEDVLGVQPLSVKANFFELGGHSLLAIKLVNLVREQFNPMFNVAGVFQAPTIEDMTNLLRDHEAICERRLVVPLRRSGSRRPIFFVHSITAEVFSFIPLASALPADLPVYAFQARGLETDEAPLERFEDMARAYVAEMRTHPGERAVPPRGALARRRDRPRDGASARGRGRDGRASRPSTASSASRTGSRRTRGSRGSRAWASS